MRARWLAVAVLMWSSAQAQPIELSGSIGGRQVVADLNRNGDTVSGWLYSLKNGTQLRLEGQLVPQGLFDITAFNAASNTRAGRFTGRIKNGHWTGNWRDNGAKAKKPVALDNLSNVSPPDGRYRCTTRRHDESFGFSLRHSLDLTLSGGKVKGLTLTRQTKSDGENAQSCRLTAGDLKQAPGKGTIILRAKADPARCTLRILSAGDYLLIRPGRTDQAGDDCRAAASSQFCSANAFWSDLVINKKSQSCKSVE
ncbi:hypothetical protein FHS83_003740 [Rhizomicrobium palustre]|uniref:Uncharacterized protein n=1 Tax=Rhizomicrobium palustre TaxID=189966 RepID=A0A846N5H6_9PROT|nr:hypothetical protein [Rhizomicrobium palustre]NIK90422.1 hypothetical protein [Rhizomicrobium palustre]